MTAAGDSRAAWLRTRLAVYVLTDRRAQRGRSEVEVAAACLRGGATALQLRAKDLPGRELCELGRRLAELCADHGALFVVNDRVDVALACGAGGVHLGQDDLPAAAARRLMGPAPVIGISAATPEEAAAARAAGADYLGVGSVFGTTTKPDAGAPIGTAGLARVVAATELPVVAIGGITAANAPAAIAAGAVGVAAISAVVGAADVTAATRSLACAVRAALACGAGAPCT